MFNTIIITGDDVAPALAQAEALGVPCARLSGSRAETLLVHPDGYPEGSDERCTAIERRREFRRWLHQQADLDWVAVAFGQESKRTVIIDCPYEMGE